MGREGHVCAEFEVLTLRYVLCLGDSNLHDEVRIEIALSKGGRLVSDLACEDLVETLLLLIEVLEGLLLGESGHWDVLFLVNIFEFGY